MSTSASEETEVENETPETEMSDLAGMEDRLRQAAQDLDDGKEVSEETLTPSRSNKQDKASAGGKPAADKTKPAPEGGRKTDTPAEQKPAGTEKPIETPEQKADRERKDNERYDRNWKKFQEEQEAHKRRVSELERRERELVERERRQPAERTAGPARDEAGYSADEYEKAAAAWERQGKYDLADLARDKAEAMRRQPARTEAGGERRPVTARYTDPAATPGTPEFTDTWNRNFAELRSTEEYKELNDKESPLFKETATVLNNDPRFSQFNDGIKIAAHIARLKIAAKAADEVPVLRQQLEEQKQELEKLRQATSPAAAHTTERGGEKPLEQMTPAEQEQHLRKMAAEVDGD